jgi:hypothetical protein
MHFLVSFQDQSSFSSSRQSAIRIKHLPPGTVQFETITEKNVTGVIGKEALPPPGGWGSRSPTKTGSQVCYLDLYLPALPCVACLSLQAWLVYTGSSWPCYVEVIFKMYCNFWHRTLSCVSKMFQKPFLECQKFFR